MVEIVVDNPEDCEGCCYIEPAVLCECSEVDSLGATYSDFADVDGSPTYYDNWTNFNSTFNFDSNVLFDEGLGTASGDCILGTLMDSGDRGLLLQELYSGGVIIQRSYIWKMRLEMACTGEGETLDITGSITWYYQLFDDGGFVFNSTISDNVTFTGDTCFTMSASGNLFSYPGTANATASAT